MGLLTLSAVLILVLMVENALEHGYLSSVTVHHSLLVPHAKMVSNIALIFIKTGTTFIMICSSYRLTDCHLLRE